MSKDKIDDLIRQLSSSDWSVAEIAADDLIAIGGAAVPALINALKDENPTVRKKTAEVLGIIAKKNPQNTELVNTVPALINALKDEDDGVRRLTVWALGEIGDSTAIPFLVNALKDKDDNVRWNAAGALGDIRDTEAIPALIDALGDKFWYVREKAAIALGVIAEKNPGNTEVFSTVPSLVDALKDKKGDVRLRAAESLNKIGLEKISLNKKIMCLLLLGKKHKIGVMGEPAIPALVVALKDENADVRKNAAVSLNKIGLEKISLNKKIMCLLLLGIDDRVVAIGKPAVPALIKALKDKNANVRKNAAWALGKIGDARAVPALVPVLIDILEDWDDHVWRRAGEALVKIGNPAVPVLIDALKHEDDSVRKRAAWTLGKIIPGLTDIRLRETEVLLMKAFEKAEGREEKEVILYVFAEINNKRNNILAPEAKKLEPPKRIKRRKRRRRMWRAAAR